MTKKLLVLESTTDSLIIFSGFKQVKANRWTMFSKGHKKYM